MESESDSDIEYQVGAHSVDTDPVQFGDEKDEFIEFDMEAKAVFKRLAEDIYDSQSAGIREPLTNSTTAVIRAQEEYGLEPHRGVIEITLEKQDGLTLIFQDNGVGISEGEIREVMSVIGRSLNRNRGDIAGRFGMGFLALWMLSGLSGGFLMHTHSRKPGKEPISGVWKNSGFFRNDPKRYEGSMGEDEYGTRFEIGLKESITGKDIREWVEKYAEWSRVPVVYQEKNAGTVEFNEDYGDKTFLDEINEESPYVLYEDEFVKAVTSDGVEGETILLDVPVARNVNLDSSHLPFESLNVRMKTENGVVVSGPNKGMTPISEGEYAEKSDTEGFIKETELEYDDIVMPGPTGTRDVLSSNSEFWAWLSEMIQDEYHDKISRILSEVDTSEDLHSLDPGKLNYLIHLSKEESIPRDKFGGVIQEKYGVSFTSQVGEMLYSFGKMVNIAAARNLSEIYKLFYKSRAGDVFRYASRHNSEVFMGVAINPKKKDVVIADSQHNIVIQVEDSGAYEIFEGLGWKKLKNIDKTNVDDFDIPESLREQFGRSPRKAQNTEDRRLKIHFNRRNVSNKEVKAKDVKSELDEYSRTGNPPTYERKELRELILFPSNSDKSLSNHYWLTSPKHGIATCSVSVWDYLSENEHVHRAEDYIEQARDERVETTSGQMEVRELPESALMHIIPNKTAHLFKDPTHMERVEEYLADSLDDIEEVTYIPVSESEYKNVRAATKGIEVISSEVSPLLFTSDRKKYTRVSDTTLYAYARLYNWWGSDETDIVKSIDNALSEEGYDFVETLAMPYDEGKMPNSLDTDSL